ncbi:MAG: dihydropteroate synthase, partial [Planctomycetota bacterium]
MEILGILNITRDSFSDGGLYLAPDQALAHARRMAADGAAIIDIGAQSTRPDAEQVSAEEELARLTPVVRALRADGVRISIDTFRPAVMQAAIELGAEFINDVNALRDPVAVAVIRDALANEPLAGVRAARGSDTFRPPLRVILMHSVARGPVAERLDISAAHIVDRILAFFRERIATLEAAGIPRERLILDPGMGLFLSTDPDASLAALRNLDRLAAFGLPLCVSPTRKSFLAHVLTTGGQTRPISERGAGSLAAELWAATQGVQYIRTHEVRALHDAWRVW